ncbi:MAG: endonuclease/exonuclease/phosphatase family protein [Bacteroidales bacterium]|nr:endonuclease/exonuclease/phosphatase family protein [Bacteroidales bacterium]
MKYFKLFLRFILGLIIAIGLFIIYASITDYKPKATSIIYESTKPDTIMLNKQINLAIWNIGYCGLSADMDFFYDGGTQVRTSFENIQTNYKSIKAILKQQDSCDFILLQEIDLKSKRSYHQNQVDLFKNSLANYDSFFAKNYDVKFIPSPITNPLGKVKSGLLSFSRYNPKQVMRYSFPGNYSWPLKLFMLDRCFLTKRIPTSNNKELIVINTHNSAYDDGSLKKKQMFFLKEFILREYQKGNYIIVGGDWNQNPPSIDHSKTPKDIKNRSIVLNPIPKDYLPQDWQWIYDSTTPSNRYLNTPYKEGESITPIIDFFLISPNIKSEQIKTLDLNFKNSDHQPIICKMKLI